MRPIKPIIERAKDAAKVWNEYRQKMTGKRFTKSQFQYDHLPYSALASKFLCENDLHLKPVDATNNGKVIYYEFTDHPIHYSLFEKAISGIYKASNKHKTTERPQKFNDEYYGGWFEPVFNHKDPYYFSKFDFHKISTHEVFLLSYFIELSRYPQNTNTFIFSIRDAKNLGFTRNNYINSLNRLIKKGVIKIHDGKANIRSIEVLYEKLNTEFWISVVKDYHRDTEETGMQIAESFAKRIIEIMPKNNTVMDKQTKDIPSLKDFRKGFGTKGIPSLKDFIKGFGLDNSIISNAQNSETKKYQQTNSNHKSKVPAQFKLGQDDYWTDVADATILKMVDKRSLHHEILKSSSTYVILSSITTRDNFKNNLMKFLTESELVEILRSSGYEVTAKKTIEL